MISTTSLLLQWFNFQKFCACVDATFLFPYKSHDNCSRDSRKKWTEVLHSNNLHIDKKIYFSSFSVNFSKLQLFWTYWLQLCHDFENFMSLFENFWFWVLTRFLAVICPRNDPVYQWRIRRLSDTSIPVWAPKLGVHIKGELIQSNISHLIISLTQIRLHVLRHVI